MIVTGIRIMLLGIYSGAWSSARQTCGREPLFAFVGEVPEEEDQGRDAG